MNKKLKAQATWRSLIAIMLQETFEPSVIFLINHDKEVIATVNGFPNYTELESIDENGNSDFNLCEWLIDGHIDAASNLEELVMIFERTRYICCNDVDEADCGWNTNVTGLRCGNPKISKFNDAGVKLDSFTLYRFA